MPQGQPKKPRTLQEITDPKTNPYTAALRDFVGSLVGFYDPITDPKASVAMGAGALASVVPVGRGVKAGVQAAKRVIPAAVERAGAQIGRLAQPIKAYHGSPHDFDKFSLSKIGTGEGAQAYGHGLYFAENERVAKDYRKALAGKELKVEYGGRQVTPLTRQHQGLLRVQEVGKDQALSEAESWLQSLRDNPNKQTMSGPISDQQKHVEWMRGVDPSAVKVDEAGRMYEVDLHASPDEFLDWDLPLSQQSEKVRKAVRQAMIDRGFPVDDAGVPLWEARNPTGESIAASLAGAKTQEHAMTLLKKGGVKGIRYLDQGSRSTNIVDDQLHKLVQKHGGDVQAAVDEMGKGMYLPPKEKAKWAVDMANDYKSKTSNYVVNDDAIIDIMKKYGVALPVAAAMKAQMDKQQPAQKGKG